MVQLLSVGKPEAPCVGGAESCSRAETHTLYMGTRTLVTSAWCVGLGTSEYEGL